LNTFTLRNRLVKVARIAEFKIDVLAKLMVLEYSTTNLFKELYNWQTAQKGEPKQILLLEELASKNNIEEIKRQFSAEWASEKVIKWLSSEPKISGVDLRDYYWISRDQLSTTISGASLIPPHIRVLSKKLINHGSGSILNKEVQQEISGKLNDSEIETLLNLLEKELIKSPENDSIHKVFIELMIHKINGVIDSYIRAINKADNTKIPFSLRNDFQLAAKNNAEIESIYKHFSKDSSIYKALNPRK